MDDATVDYFAWLKRVFGWDAALPFFVSAGALAIANALKNQPPADILALVGLPALAFTIRLSVGGHQIGANACGTIFRRFQFVSLVLALFILAFVDFFIALVAFLPEASIPEADVLTPLGTISLSVYLSLVAFAMYPGRLGKES